MALTFLDTNILLRHLLQDHPVHSPKATAYLERIEQGELSVRTADTVIFETVFVLERSYHQPKPKIRDLLLDLVELPNVILPRKRRLRAAFDLYVNLNLPFADAYHAALMRELKLVEIATFDLDFDHVPGIRRIVL
jgi:predicted nucleic acid-binding protein